MLILSAPPKSFRRRKLCCGNCKSGKPCCGKKKPFQPAFAKQGGLWLPRRKIEPTRNLLQFPSEAEWAGLWRPWTPPAVQTIDMSCMPCCECLACCCNTAGGSVEATFVVGASGFDCWDTAPTTEIFDVPLTFDAPNLLRHGTFEAHGHEITIKIWDIQSTDPEFTEQPVLSDGCFALQIFCDGNQADSLVGNVGDSTCEPLYAEFESAFGFIACDTGNSCPAASITYVLTE